MSVCRVLLRQSAQLHETVLDVHFSRIEKEATQTLLNRSTAGKQAI